MLVVNEILGTKVLAPNEVDNDGSSSDGSSDGSKYVELKTGRSENQKTSKSQKLAKSKKPSKSENSPNFDTKNSGPSFPTPEARVAFNHLRLAFTKAPILWHFNPKCHIWIETDASGYGIGDVLSQLASETWLDGVVTKIDLG